MRGFSRKGLLLLLGAVVMGGTFPKAARAQAKDDEGAIKALYERFATAFKAKDVNGIMEWYLASEKLFVFDVIPPRQYVGAKAYRRDWEEFLAAFPVVTQFEVTDLSVTTDGSLAYAHSTQHMVAQDTKGKNVEINFRVTDCFRKVKGRWLVTHEHVSVPVDLATGKADVLAKP